MQPKACPISNIDHSGGQPAIADPTEPPSVGATLPYTAPMVKVSVSDCVNQRSTLREMGPNQHKTPGFILKKLVRTDYTG